MSAADVTLLRPGWLLALPALALVGWWLWQRRGGLGDWQRASDPALLRAMAALGRVDQGASRAPLVAMLAALGLIILGLAGPAVERRDTLSYRNLDGVLFVIDASPSVTTHARWSQLQAMGRFGLAALGTRPGGLIVFAGDAYVATDMTRDHLQLGQTLSLIGPETVPDPGSRPERALALAETVLAEAGVLAGDVVVMTDGAGLGPSSLQATGAIAARGARVSLVALEGLTPAFETHAAVGQGRVFTLGETGALTDWLTEAARSRLERQQTPLLFWTDLGRYLLLLALVPLLTLFRRSAV
ncbi:VWA domain-containing protein [uncultured Roseobacter sp.]|uniref:vWA domain-containing protein n=1 Tax=uncultured Roseobacter sp. TaxID=114847 RepID=UPI002632C625|nr:VWA domain-containing protein [uncultured Roseobacter sp.]